MSFKKKSLLLAMFLAVPGVSLAEDGPCPTDCDAVVGDVNRDGWVDVADQVHLAEFLFWGGDLEVCDVLADVNGDDRVDMSDFIYFHHYLWLGGASLVSPLVPGDVNMDGLVDISDLTVLGGIYKSGAELKCEATADVNADCFVDISDIQMLGSYLHRRGREPVLISCR